MKWLFLVTFTLLAVNVFSAAFNNEEDASLKELQEDEKERADGTETGEGQGRFVRETKEELEDVEDVKEDEREDEPEMVKTYLTENDDSENDESEDTSPELDEKEDPIDIKADFDANEDMDIRNETPEQ